MSREVDNKILEKLAEWKQKESALPNVVELYEELLHLQCEAKSHISGRSLTREVILERLERGSPLQELPLDWSLLGNLFHQIITIIGEHLSISPEEVNGLRDIAFDGALVQQLVEVWYEKKPLPSPVASVNTGLLSTIIQASLWPFLTVQSEILLPQLDQEKWRKRYCPVCGGKADFSFLEKENGARWLSCCRCDAEWLFQRLECPYCGNQEQSKLAYFTDEEGLYRLYTCEQCRGYIKAIDLRKTTEEVLLPLEKILTTDMDSQAQARGYNPGWSNNL